MYTVAIMVHNTYYYQEYEDFWDLTIDGNSVSGLDFYKQEARTARFTLLLDEWLRTHITQVADSEVYKSYYRMLFLIKKDGEVLFSGFMRTTDYEVDYITEQIQELTITLYDWLYVLIDQGDEIKRNIVEGTQYDPINEVRTGILLLCANMLGLTTGLLYYGAIDNYDDTQWTPYLLTDFVLYRLSDYVLQFNDVVYENLQYINLELVNGELIMHCVFYKLGIKTSSHHTYALTEKLRYAKYRVEGLNIILISEIIDSYTGNWHSNNNNQTIVPEYYLADLYDIPEDNDTELITVNGNEYKVSDGQLLFTGYTVFNPITAASTQTVNIMDWIRLCGMINAVYLDLSYCTIRIRNKVAIYDTTYETVLPGELLQLKQVNNTYRNDEIDVNADIIVNGKEITAAINNYFRGLIQGNFKNMFELTLDGCHTEVNIRYLYNGIILYIMSAEYDMESDVTKLKALGKRL